VVELGLGALHGPTGRHVGGSPYQKSMHGPNRIGPHRTEQPQHFQTSFFFFKNEFFSDYFFFRMISFQTLIRFPNHNNY
jgi:hypothetical protein